MEQPLEERKEIYFAFFTKMIKQTLKDIGEELKRKSGLPLDIIFQIVIGPETEKRLLKQKKVVFAGAEMYDGTEETNAKVVEELFPKYLRSDSHNANLRKKDAKYPEAVEIIKRLFLCRCGIDHQHLKGYGSSYDEIVKTAFKTKENAKEIIGAEFVIVDELNAFLLSRRRLINVPGIVKTEVITATETTGTMIKESMFREIDRVFG